MLLWGTPRENGGLLQDKEDKSLGFFFFFFSDGSLSVFYTEKILGFFFLYISGPFRSIRLCVLESGVAAKSICRNGGREVAEVTCISTNRKRFYRGTITKFFSFLFLTRLYLRGSLRLTYQ